ncbi:hypothetical protein GGF46_004810 [Coemansia sp. RSA 552]|nr:hypothetical protein GGF46_004810 [Coemansia sp. RSA 552]
MDPGKTGAAEDGLGVSGSARRSVSRRSSVVSTSSSFFERSFFSTPTTRIVDHGRHATLAYATLMLNVYNDAALDLRTAVAGNRRVVVQTVAAKSRAAQLDAPLARVHADADDAVAATRALGTLRELDSVRDLLCRTVRIHEEIAHARHK